MQQPSDLQMNEKPETRSLRAMAVGCLASRSRLELRAATRTVFAVHKVSEYPEMDRLSCPSEGRVLAVALPLDSQADTDSLGTTGLAHTSYCREADLAPAVLLVVDFETVYSAMVVINNLPVNQSLLFFSR